MSHTKTPLLCLQDASRTDFGWLLDRFLIDLELIVDRFRIVFVCTPRTLEHKMSARAFLTSVHTFEKRSWSLEEDPVLRLLECKYDSTDF